MHGGVFEKLIERNSTIPTKNTKVFTTVADNQSVVEIHVLQGEREIAKDNKSLGRFELVGIPTAPRGVPQIEVTFAIDSNGIVNVSARDLATGKAQGMQINPAGGLSQSEIDKIIKEASAFAEADHERREIAAIRNRLEGMIASNERVLGEFGGALADDERERIEETLKRSREIAAGESREALQRGHLRHAGRVEGADPRHARSGPAPVARRRAASHALLTIPMARDATTTRSSRSPATRRGGAEVRLPQARADLPPRPQPQQPGCLREVQGGVGGLRRALGPREARALRPVRARGRRVGARRAEASPASIRRPSPTSRISSAGSSVSRPAAGSKAAGPSAGATSSTGWRSRFEDAAYGVEAPIAISRLESCGDCDGAGAGAGHDGRGRARPAGAADASGSRRGSSR